MAGKFVPFTKGGKAPKEGSKKEEALDKKEMKMGGGLKVPNPGKKPTPAFMVGKKK